MKKVFGKGDFIIKDEQDLHNHLDYIHYNPVKHGYVQKVCNWKYSSFHKFVKSENYEINWGDNGSVIKVDYD